MGGQLRRWALLGPLVSTGVLLLAIVVAVSVADFSQTGGFIQRVQGEPTQARMRVIAVTAALALVGLVGGAALALRQARRVEDAMRALGEQTAALAEGQTRLRHLHTGVEDVDALSRLLVRASIESGRTVAEGREFAADASHQLRTPLTAVLMRLEEIAMTDELDVAHEEAEGAIEQVERLSEVVDTLLARRRSATAAPAISLDSVLAALQREWNPAFAQARRSVRIVGERDLRVRANPSALSQILATIIENSLVHGGGTVSVAARRSGPSVVVEISDEGPGVSPVIAPHIFERSVTDGMGDSTGTGLALARDLAEANGGRLDLVSPRAATFALFLSDARTGA